MIIKKISLKDRWNNLKLSEKTLHHKYNGIHIQGSYNFSKNADPQQIIFVPGIYCSEEGPWIAGGAARDLFFGKNLKNDMDIFFADKLQLEIARAKITDPISSVRMDLKSKSSHSENYEYIGGYKNKKYDIQLVTYDFFNNIEQLFSSFDFNCCQFAFDGENIYYTDIAIADCENKTLSFVNDKNFHSFSRVSKYFKKGFNGSLPSTFSNTKIEILSEIQLTDIKYFANTSDKRLLWSGQITSDRIEDICRCSGVYPERIQLSDDSYHRESPAYIKFSSQEDKNLFVLMNSK